MSDYLEEQFGLKGRAAVVVGGTGVLCGQMAVALAKAGARVLVAGRDASKVPDELATASPSASFHSVDVTDFASLQRLHDAAIERMGAVDILINGAGVNNATPYYEIAPEDWNRVLATNLTALHQTCQLFTRGMVERQRGCVINIASVSALTPLSRVFAYSASKAAVLNYTLNLARELGPSGVRVNAITPGFFPAEQNRAILDGERTTKILARTPLGRFGEPDELDGAVLLLASDRAGRFITGTNLVVDGGFSATSI